MEVSPKIPIYTFLATLAYNGISIIAFLKAPDLECIFGDTWLTGIFGGTSSIELLTMFRLSEVGSEHKANAGFISFSQLVQKEEHIGNKLTTVSADT